MKRILILATVVGLASAAAASAHSTGATLVIRHQLHGCHSWSVKSGDASGLRSRSQ